MSLTTRKRRLFLAFTLLLPWLLLLTLEVGLRAGGYGNSYPLFVSFPDHPDYLAPNQQVAKRYFGNGPFAPTPQLDFFRAVKRPGAFRIVFQGESSAIGFPYLHGGAPSRMLEQRLQATFPERDIEVVNTALTAVNSYTLLDFSGEIIEQRPDAVMIYTGHNEYYGAFGVGSTSAIVRNRLLVRAYLALSRLRTAQLVLNTVQRDPPGAGSQGSTSAPRNVMELMAGDQRIPLGSARYRDGLEQFRANLDELLSRYQAHGIPVFIGTIASNERDQPPFVSGLRASTDSAAWRRLYESGVAALQKGDTARAEREFGRAMQMDSSAADVLYALARLNDARSNFQRAAQLYRAARDHDELRFRAPDAMNVIIREAAARHGAEVVETQRVLQHASPGGIIGHSMMLEHLHPTIDGYFLIASAFFDAMKQRGMIGDWQNAPSIASARTMIPVTAVDSLIGLFHTDRLTSGWPFQRRGMDRVPIVDTLTPKTGIDQLAQGVVLGNVSWPEAMDRLRILYEQQGDFDRAIQIALAMAQEYRYSAQPFVDASRIEIGRRRYDAALRYVLAATERHETPKTVQLAGLLLLRQGDHARAVQFLERSVKLAPSEQQMKVSLRAAIAIPALEQARDNAMKDTTVLYTLAGAYALTQQYEKSRAVISALLQLAPRHAAGNQLLRRIPSS